MEYEKFRDYMYYLLTAPFKRVIKKSNQWYILFTVLGDKFDESMERIYKAHEQTMLATCDDVMLQEHASDRGMKRYIGENDENFRARIANYSEVLKLGGTDAGVILAVKSLGFEDVKIVKTKLYKQDKNRWAEFHLLIKIKPDEELPIGYDVLKQYVRKNKYIGARDNYEIGIELGEQKVESNNVARSVQILGRDTQRYSNNERMTIRMESITESHTGLAVETKYDMWKFDGTVKFDGTRKFDAWQRREEL